MTTTIPGVTPTNPYGQDFAIVLNGGVLDFLPTMGLTNGRQLLVQSLICRQTTPTGSVIDCPNDCFDVRDWISEGMTLQELSQLATTISNELSKDQRVLSANVTCAFGLSTSVLSITEQIQSSYGPFSFTLAIDSVTGTLLLQNLSTPIANVAGSTGADSLT